MPMVGHQAPREYAHRYPLLDLRQHALEGLVVAIRVEDAAFTVRPIEHMKDKAPGASAMALAWLINARPRSAVDGKVRPLFWKRV